LGKSFEPLTELAVKALGRFGLSSAMSRRISCRSLLASGVRKKGGFTA
jgi:hypothetical protein